MYLVENLVYTILNRLERNYNISIIIILDRNILFILNFQRSLTRRLGVKLKILPIIY